MSANIKKNPDVVPWGRQSSKKSGPDTSDHAVLAVLKRLKTTSDPTEIRELSNRLERTIFHKQLKSA